MFQAHIVCVQEGHAHIAQAAIELAHSRSPVSLTVAPTVVLALGLESENHEIQDIPLVR